MTKRLEMAVGALEQVPRSDREAISKIRQAVADRAMYFAEQDPDITRREAAIASEIHERYNTRDVMKEQIDGWKKFYKMLGLDSPSLEEFESAHIDVPAQETRYLRYLHSDLEPEFVVAPQFDEEHWAHLFFQASIGTLRFKVQPSYPYSLDTENEHVSETRTFRHGQVWTVSPAPLVNTKFSEELVTTGRLRFNNFQPSVHQLLAIMLRDCVERNDSWMVNVADTDSHDRFKRDGSLEGPSLVPVIRIEEHLRYDEVVLGTKEANYIAQA